jgi:hypothetical protein
VVVVAVGILRFAESEERGGVVWGDLNGGLEALDLVVKVGGADAADVVLEGAEGDALGGGEEGLLGYVEVWIDLAGDLPGDGVFDVEEALEFAGVGEGLRHAELIDVEDLGLDGDTVLIDGVVADDDVVGVEGLGDTDGGGAGGAEVGGEAEVIERELEVVAGDGEEACGGEALVEGIGEGVADPAKVGLAGAVVEGQDEDDTARAGRGFGGQREGVEAAQKERDGEPSVLQDSADLSEARHSSSI